MEHTPPPFFKRGPAPVVRLAFFASLSFALLVLDARFRVTDDVRRVLALAAYPFQRIATAPFELGARIADFFVTQEHLRQQNVELNTRLLAISLEAQRSRSLESELASLRQLVGARERIDRQAIAAEILYAGRDPYDYKVIINRGTQHGVAPGGPVVDGQGVVGQVTRAHALIAEVTLINDKDHAIPVQVVRNGLRAVAFGAGASGMLEVRFMAANADIDNGDELVTSGLDGVYPAGLTVARVVRVERDASQAFARIVCQPTAGVDRGRHVLVLASDVKPRPEPMAEPERKPRGRTRSARGAQEDGRGAR